MVEPSDFDTLLNREIFYFMELKRLYALQMKVISLCEDRPIKNDLIYEQLLFAAVDGLFVRFDNFHVRLLQTLEIFRQRHLDFFKRNNKRGLAEDPARIRIYGAKDEEQRKRIAREEAIRLTKTLQSNYDAVYDKLFPGVRQRSEGRPNHDDFDVVMKALTKVFEPIRGHRDTVVAHWDKNQQPATVNDLNRAMSHVEELLGATYLITKLGQHGFELGGIAADVDRTARDLAELIMGPFRVRQAKPEDMTDVFMMGFDVWANRQNKETYLKGCRESTKYAKGIWYVLEDRAGKPVSSLITYTFPVTEEEKPAIGLGSIATLPDLRKRGHAGQLIWEVLRLHHDRDKIRVAYLWAEVCPELYERYGFVRLPDRAQTKPGSVAMIRAPKERLDTFLADPNFQVPGYF